MTPRRASTIPIIGAIMIVFALALIVLALLQLPFVVAAAPWLSSTWMMLVLAVLAVAGGVLIIRGRRQPRYEAD